MEDNRYLEQAAALLDKAKEAGEALGIVLVATGRKSGFKVNGSSVAVLNTLLNLNGKGDDFESVLATAIAALMLGNGDLAHKIDTLRAHPADLIKALEKSSKKLDAEIAESEAKRKASEDETEKEESHDSEEAA